MCAYHSVCAEVRGQLVGRASLPFYSVGPRMELNPSGLVRSLTYWAILLASPPHPPNCLVLKIDLFLLCMYGCSSAYTYVHYMCARWLLRSRRGHQILWSYR